MLLTELAAAVTERVDELEVDHPSSSAQMWAWLATTAPAAELVPPQPGERVVGLAPLGEQAGSPGLAVGIMQGVVKV